MDMDQIFCSNQIVIPPTLPSILKKFAKAAIRTQPYDLLVWSTAYFRAMALGGAPPIKARLEFPLPENRQLTLGYVKLLVYQFGKSGEVTREEVNQKWSDVCLPQDTLYSILRLGSFAQIIEWDKFVAITLGFLEECLKGTMLRICEVMTEEPEGGSAMIPSQLFLKLYRYLGEMDCGEIKPKKVSAAVPEDEKVPCLPDVDELDKGSGKDIDSVIKEIGDVESIVSIETRFEGTGMDFDWPNLESRSGSDVTEIVVPSEPSDVGATSKYGIEAMTEISEVHAQQTEAGKSKTITKPDWDAEAFIGDESVQRKEKGEIQELYVEKRRHPRSEPDSQISEDPDIDETARTTDLILGSITLTDLIPTTDKDMLNEMDQAFKEAEESKMTIAKESKSEIGSVITVIGEREAEDEQSPSEKDSQTSENKKALLLMGDSDGNWQENTSLIDLRPTLDRNLRRKMMDDAVQGEEKRKAEELRAALEAAERLRIEEEAKVKYHMHVPGIGPRLPNELMNEFEEYIRCCAQRQQGMVMPRNIRHFLCPPLDLGTLDRSKDLTDLLEAATQIPEDVIPTDLKPDVIELIQTVPGFYQESLAESSISSESMASAILTREISTNSYQTFGLATSLTYLLNQEK